MSDLESTDLHKLLRHKCDSGEARPIDGIALLACVKNATDQMGILLDRACIEFDDYTLHDRAHAVRVVENMYRLMGEALAQRLSPIEISVLILSGYGHDVGMAVGREMSAQIREEPAYRDFLLRHELEWQEAQQALAAGDLQRHEFLDRMLFQEHLRSRHHQLSEWIITNRLADAFRVNEKSLARPVAKICRSHGDPIEDVAAMEFVPFAGRFRIDMQFLACVLRLADFLDFDASRAPVSMMNLITPDNERARREWRKTQACNFYIDHEKIQFSAVFDNFFEEKGLRDTLEAMERERRDCVELLKSRSDPSALRLTLDRPVDFSGIESIGYIYEEFNFELEFREIMSLLMGVHLYKDEQVFVRELLQNALDACRHAEAAAISEGRHDYRGRISVVLRRSLDEEILEVSDNGAGMTKAIIRDYFMRVGRSYYRSFAFRRKGLNMHAVSQFGIGVLSCFMRADYIEVETRPDPAVHDDATSDELLALKLEIHGPHEFFVVRESEVKTPGTTVRLKLRGPLVESPLQIVNRFIGRIPYRVDVREDNEPAVDVSPIPFGFDQDVFQGAFAEYPGALSYAYRDLDLEGKLGFDTTGSIRLFLLEIGGRKRLRVHDDARFKYVGFSQRGEALVIVRQLTPESRERLVHSLSAAKHHALGLPRQLQVDLLSIISEFDRLSSQLLSQANGDQARARWRALDARIAAIETAPEFCADARSIEIHQLLMDACGELGEFVDGSLKLGEPRGILTQDGIRLANAPALPEKLGLGLGYLYNIDLCGPHRLTLNAARDSVGTDERLTSLIRHLHSVIGPFVSRWFDEEGIGAEELNEYLDTVPSSLGNAIMQSKRRSSDV